MLIKFKIAEIRILNVSGDLRYFGVPENIEDIDLFDKSADAMGTYELVQLIPFDVDCDPESLCYGMRFLQQVEVDENSIINPIIKEAFKDLKEDLKIVWGAPANSDE